jgi:DNA-directed RNA polymerase specialized sigma subunit
LRKAAKANLSEEDPLLASLRPEIWESLTHAILHLPERERLVFTISYYEELTTDKIELLLGETKSNVLVFALPP